MASKGPSAETVSNETEAPVAKKSPAKDIKNFIIKSKAGNRVGNVKGTGFEVDEGVVTIFNGKSPVSFFDIEGFFVEIKSNEE